jgi:LacI family transcriptional regulator
LITLSKLAKMANVSVSTASKAFSMSHEVSEETRNHIFEIAKSEGVFKKFYNAKYPKLVIAVICPEFEGRHYSGVIATLRQELSALGCEMTVASSDFSKDTGNELFEYYSNYTSVDGIIILDSEVDRLSYEVPTVYMYAPKLPEDEKDKCPRAYVGVSQYKAIAEGIEYFKSHGIRDIGYIGEPLTISRYEKFIKAMSSAGLVPREGAVILDGARFEEGGYRAMLELIDKNTLPRAVFCAYDHMAIGAMRALYERGLSVPRDVRLFAVDDISEAKYLTPSLSSINIKSRLRCTAAAETVVNMILGKPYRKHLDVDAELIIRESTG